MRFKSNIWKDRSVNVRNHIGIVFDSEGNCDIDVVDDDEAKFLCTNILGLYVVHENSNDLKLELVKEKIISSETDSINIDEIKINQDALNNSVNLSEKEIAKKEAIEKINDIKKLSTLKKLAKEFDEQEWSEMTTESQLKKYLISKI
jgi:hypothetical protein